jgi:hypothetical protein
LICAARLHGLLGEVDRAVDLAAEAELAASRQGLGGLLADVRLARGSAWLSAGRHADAYRELRHLFDPADRGFHQRERLAGVTYLAEAAVRSGHAADARAVVADLVDVAAVVQSPLLRVNLLHARAVLAPEADAEPWYRAGLRADLTGWPWIRARIELAYGGWLCRHGRSGEARPLLRSALAVLDRIGARAWADHAREVLATLD